MLVVASETVRRFLLVVLVIALLGASMFLAVDGTDARTGTLCRDIANRQRAAIASGNLDQANAAGEILDYSNC